MSTAIAVVTALGVVVAILANLTNIARFMEERRSKRAAAVTALTGTAAPTGSGTTADLTAVLLPTAAPPTELEVAVPVGVGRSSAAARTEAPATGQAGTAGSGRRWRRAGSGAAWPALADDDQRPPLDVVELPRQLTPFIGRRQALDQLTELLRDDGVRLVTVHGPGGIGKSRIAIEVASRLEDEYPDGVAFVALDAVRDAALLAGEIATALGLRETAGGGPIERLVASLARRQMLLILDNFEGLLDGVPLLSRLLSAAPGLKILVTSRSVLRARGEVAFPIPPMLLPDPRHGVSVEDALQFGGVELFVARAKDVSPDFELDEENLQAVIEICRRVDGLPLAIELAAARLRTLPPSALLERMDRRLPLLTGGPRDAPARQRTLRDTIAWSYEQLGEQEKYLFARLSVFDGPTYLEAIESVLGDRQLLDQLAALVDSSLLMRVDPDAGLFNMLETIREFAQERLESDPERERWRAVHARYYRMFASIASAALRAPDQATWLDRLRHSDGNLRASLTYLCDGGDKVETLRLAVDLRPYWQRVGALSEGRRWLERGLELPDELPRPLEGAALLAKGVLAWRQGDLEAARPALEASLSIAREVDDPASSITALRSLGALAQNKADYATAKRLMQESVTLAVRAGDTEAEANSYLSLGNVALDQGLHEEADAHYRKSKELSASIADTLGLAYAIDNLGVSAWHRGDLDLATELSDQALALYEQLDMQSGRANVWHRRCLVALERGRLKEAEFEGGRALAVRLAQGEDRAGAFVLYDLARVALASRNPALAKERLARGFELARPQGAPVIDVLFVEGTAAYLEQVGEEHDAYLLLAAAESWRARLGVPIAPVVLEHQRRLGKRLSGRLDAFTRAGIEERARSLSVSDLLEQTAVQLA